MSLEEARIHLPTDPFGSEELELFRKLAERHGDPQDIGRIALLDVNREAHRAQGAYLVDGEKLPPAALDMLATEIEPAYPEISARLAGEQSRGMAKLRRLLDRGDNVVLALPHGPLTDIGVSLAAIHNGLLAADPELEFRSAIIVSMTLQMMGVRFGSGIVEAPEALGYVCDRVYFSVPRTERVEESEFARLVHERRISAHNTAMLGDLTGLLDEGGVLLAVALSGTTDKLLPDGTHLMAPVTAGTIRLIQHPKTYVQPVAAKLEGLSRPVFELCGDPRRIGNAAAAHEVMNDIAAGLTDQGEGIRFVYDDPGK